MQFKKYYVITEELPVNKDGEPIHPKKAKEFTEKWLPLVADSWFKRRDNPPSSQVLFSHNGLVILE